MHSLGVARLDEMMPQYEVRVINPDSGTCLYSRITRTLPEAIQIGQDHRERFPYDYFKIVDLDVIPERNVYASENA